MTLKFPPKKILETFIIFSLLSTLILLVKTDERAKKIQDDYWKSNPIFPNEPIITTKPTTKEAYAYLYCSRPQIDTGGGYLDALLVAVYRLKVVNDYYDTNPKDIVVMVCSYTPQEKIDKIKALGVSVVAVDPIIPTGDLAGNPFYIDQFTKIHMWRLTQWERIFYLDIDTTVTKDVITVWDEPGAQIKTMPKDGKNKEYYPYLFAAVEDLPCRNRCDYFNAGVFMIKPDMVYYTRLIEHMNDKGIGRGFMEQDYFNHMFRPDGPSPSAKLPAIYNHFVEFNGEFEPGTRVLHCKLWDRNNDQIRKYHDGWWDEFNHIWKNKPLSIERVYDLEDVFIMNSTNKEAYVFLLTNDQEVATDYFMTFQALKLSITQIKDFQKDSKVDRDIIVLAGEEIPLWRLDELQKFGAMVIRVRSLKHRSDDYLKLLLWKLVGRERLLFIDNNIFLNSKDFVNIWNENSIKTITKPKPDSKQPLKNIPSQNVDKFYPYVFAAASDSKQGKFNSGLFMFKPSIRHHDYLMSLLATNDNKGEQSLLNYAYSQDSPIPSSTIDQSYNLLSAGKDSPVNSIKAVNAKLWTSEIDSNPFVNKFWKAFNEFAMKRDINTIFADNLLPANCAEGSSPTRCSSCDSGYNYKEDSYLICPGGVPFGQSASWFDFSSDQCIGISNDCLSCIKEGNCNTCESGFFNAKHLCVINPTGSNDVVAYCSPSSEKGMSYIAKGNFCSHRVTVGEIVELALALALSLIIFMLVARCLIWRIIKRRIRRTKYAKMEESVTNIEDSGMPSTPGSSNNPVIKV